MNLIPHDRPEDELKAGSVPDDQRAAQEASPAVSTAAMLDRLGRRLDSLATRVNNPNAGHYAPHRPSPAAQRTTEQEGFEQYWVILKRRKWSLLLMTVVGSVGGILYTLPQQPVYEARTSIEVLDNSEPMMALKDPGGSSGSFVAETNLQTQVSILQSASLEKRVVEKLEGTAMQLPAPNDRYESWRKVFNLPSSRKADRNDLIAATASGVSIKALPTNRIIEIACDSRIRNWLRSMPIRWPPSL